jgi:hypothetical protein
MSKSDFAKHQLAGSLPATLFLAADLSPLPCGTGLFDTTQVLDFRRVIFLQVWYTTPKRIHGLLHYDSPAQLFFFGYECQSCNEVFLVPDTVTDETSLARALRHGCTRALSGPDSRFDLRTRVLHIVQDIGRPSDLGSVGCEQYADMLMELLEVPQ